MPVLRVSKLKVILQKMHHPIEQVVCVTCMCIRICLYFPPGIHYGVPFVSKLVKKNFTMWDINTGGDIIYTGGDIIYYTSGDIIYSI